MAPLTLLLTRPEAQSRRFATECASHLPSDLSIVVSPLAEIRARMLPPIDETVTALAFTSENAVRVFADQSPRRDLLAYCVGQRTAKVAEAVGFTTRTGGGGAEALAALIAGEAPRDGNILHLHGVEVSGDLSGDLHRRGVRATDAVIYEQQSRPLSDAAQTALAATDPVLVPVFSVRSAERLRPYLEKSNASLRLAAISPAVATALSVQSGAKVYVASRPSGPAMIEALQVLTQNRSDLEP